MQIHILDSHTRTHTDTLMQRGDKLYRERGVKTSSIYSTLVDVCTNMAVITKDDPNIKVTAVLT